MPHHVMTRFKDADFDVESVKSFEDLPQNVRHPSERRHSEFTNPGPIQLIGIYRMDGDWVSVRTQWDLWGEAAACGPTPERF